MTKLIEQVEALEKRLAEREGQLELTLQQRRENFDLACSLKTELEETARARDELADRLSTVNARNSDLERKVKALERILDICGPLN